MLHPFLIYCPKSEAMKAHTKIKISSFCNHHWKAVPAIGVRKYMCSQCSMFGFKRKDDPLHRMHEHSVEVSDDLLEQYIAFVQPVVTYEEPERLGPKPGITRVHEDDVCAHDWVPAPEYSDNHHPRLKCTKCERVGKERSTGEIVTFAREYAESLRRYQIRKQHLEDEPICEHEWELVPELGTKCINRYECKKCKWLGYRAGTRVPILVHTALSVDRIRSENGLRKESDDKEREPKESVLAEGTKEESQQSQEEVHISTTEDSTNI